MELRVQEIIRIRMSSYVNVAIFISSFNQPLYLKSLFMPRIIFFYLELVYLVTALVPSDTACFANSPGSRSLTAVWISLEVMVDRLL